ncbi:MAG TPA: hypothetical protein VM070_06595 [Candidatus Saccharimonadales bacterium]|nr:hypothetical protein [Candidatus Saccharimonadales bacterium]
MNLAVLAAAVSALFATVVLGRYLGQRRPYQLVWAIGLFLFAIAAAAGAMARTSGVNAIEYRVFYLFGAILNVAWLGLGTVYLLARRGWATASLVAVIALSLVAVYAVFSAPVDLAAAVDSGRGFQDAPLPRILAGLGSGVGSIVLIGGALWSAWVFLRRRHNGRRALANMIIAAGVLIVAAGGTATFTGASGILELTNLIGISVMFAGFLLV